MREGDEKVFLRPIAALGFGTGGPLTLQESLALLFVLQASDRRGDGSIG